MSLEKLTIASVWLGYIGSRVAEPFSANVPTLMLDIPVTTFGAAFAGSALSLCFGEPIQSRKELFGQVIAAAVFGTAAAVLMADGFELEWASRNMGMFALVTAAILRWFLPSIINRAKQIITEFKPPFRNKD